METKWKIGEWLCAGVSALSQLAGSSQAADPPPVPIQLAPIYSYLTSTDFLPLDYQPQLIIILLFFFFLCALSGIRNFSQ